MSGIGMFKEEWEKAFDWHKEALRPAGELDWFAVDSKGQIACFMTAGFALVPKLVFRDKQTLWNVYSYFYEEPKDYVIVRKNSSLMEYDISLYAERGIFSFDNPSDITKPYRIIRKPQEPAHISKTPLEIQEWLRPLTISKLDFANISEIDASKHFECI